jgi:hypothetical protein
MMFYTIDMDHHKLGTPVLLIGVEPTPKITVTHSILRGFRHGVIVAAYKERDFYKYRVIEATEGNHILTVIDPDFTVTDDTSFVCDRVRSQLRENGIPLLGDTKETISRPKDLPIS